MFEITSIKGPCKHENLIVGNDVCVECQAVAMKSTRRCVGEGINKIESRWKLLGDQNCQGKWRKMKDETKCECMKKKMFIFV